MNTASTFGEGNNERVRVTQRDSSEQIRWIFWFFWDFSGDTVNFWGIRSCVDGFKVALEPSFR